MYKEAGIASYGDWSLLNKRYLGIIKIKNMKDVTSDLKNAYVPSDNTSEVEIDTSSSES